MSKGFTLTEVLVIIAIIGILILIGIPAFRAYQPNLQLSKTVQELVTDIRYSQQLAITEQVGHGVYFSTSTNEYQIIRYGIEEEILKTKDFPKEVSFQEITGFSDSEVKFNPYGAAEKAGTVILINTKSNITTIEVKPSGFVKIIK